MYLPVLLMWLHWMGMPSIKLERFNWRLLPIITRFPAIYCVIHHCLNLIAGVQIEMRNPEESLKAMGTHTVKEGVKGYYPAFDITPPTLISGVVTSAGIFSPFDLKNHFKVVDRLSYAILNNIEK